MTDYAKNKIIDLMLGMGDDEAQIAYEALQNRLEAAEADAAAKAADEPTTGILTALEEVTHNFAEAIRGALYG